MITEFDDNIPIFLQIVEIIKSNIVSQKLNPGEKLISVREYARELEVNPNTVLRAYSELEREGITFTRRGMGFFITEDIDKITQLKKEIGKTTVYTFVKAMKQYGYSKSEIFESLEYYFSEEEENE